MANNEKPVLGRWPEGMERTCKVCEKTKPLADFAKGDKGRPRLKCRDCAAEAHRKWREKNAEHVKEWHQKYNEDPERQQKHRDRQRHYYYRDTRYRQDRNLRLRFGITLDEYLVMEAAQDGKCAVCHLACKSSRSLAVDHDHVTGQVRGLLCMNCNRAIGWLQDNPDLLMDAAAYLLSHRNVLEGIA